VFVALIITSHPQIHFYIGCEFFAVGFDAVTGATDAIGIRNTKAKTIDRTLLRIYLPPTSIYLSKLMRSL
jgi:hypothetical protein